MTLASSDNDQQYAQEDEQASLALWGMLGVLVIMGWVGLALKAIEWNMVTAMVLLYGPVLVPLAMHTHWKRIQNTKEAGDGR